MTNKQAFLTRSKTMYEIIIKENGEEKHRIINAEGFCLFTVSNGEIDGKTLLPNATGGTVMTLIDALQDTIDRLWNDIGVYDEKERKFLLAFNKLLSHEKEENEE